MPIAQDRATYYVEVLTRQCRGQRIEIGDLPVTIGRSAGCDLLIDDPAVSRRHARLERRGDGCYLIDLRSLNGTTVNGRKVKAPKRLEGGDLIHIHSSVLVFNPEPSKPEVDEDWRESGGAGVPGPLADEPASDSVVARLDVVDTGWAGPGVAAVRTARHMARYLGVSFSADEVAHRLLEGLFGLFPQAERGIVLLADARGELAVRGLKCKCLEASDPMTVGPLAHDIATSVMRDEQALLCCDRPIGGDDGSDVVLSVGARWSMYAPLMGPDGRPAGVVQLDTQDAEFPFAALDLEILSLAALVAGQSLAHALAAAPPAALPA
jgi:hypothetical protein